MKKLLVFLMISCMVSSGFAVEPAKPASTNASTGSGGANDQRKLISLDFPDTPLSTVLEVMSIKTGRKFITDGDMARRRIVMSLRDVTADEALDALLDAYNLYYVRQSETSSIYVIKARPASNPVTTVSKLIFLNFANAKSLEAVVKNKLTSAGNVMSEDRTNSLIVNDISDNLDKIAELVRSLDIPTLQVQLEAKIIDVKIGSDNEFGVSFENLYRDGKYYAAPLDLYKNSFFANYVMPETDVRPEVNYTQSFAPGLTNSGILNFALLTNGYNIQAAIEAVKQNNNARLLTNPRLLVLNNEEASINIIDQIPYQERAIVGQVVNFSVNFKEVGIKLKVRPQISRDGTIILNVNPENSYQTGTLDGVPVINYSRSQTTFILKDGETAVIGGLIRETDQTTEYKIPLLGDIPILGYLFRKSSKVKARSELTIFITAKVIQ